MCFKASFDTLVAPFRVGILLATSVGLSAVMCFLLDRILS